MISSFWKFPLFPFHVAEKANGPSLFPHRTYVSSASRKAWGGWIESRSAVKFRTSLFAVYVCPRALPFCTSGVGSKVGPHGGDRIKMIFKHSGFPTIETVSSDLKEKEIYWKNIKKLIELIGRLSENWPQKSQLRSNHRDT